MNFQVGKTYEIRTPGILNTFGTLTAIELESGEIIVLWRSDHPDATDDHWARSNQIVREVAPGTYLGDDGKPTNPNTFMARVIEETDDALMVLVDSEFGVAIPWEHISESFIEQWTRGQIKLDQDVTVYRANQFDLHIYT